MHRTGRSLAQMSDTYKGAYKDTGVSISPTSTPDLKEVAVPRLCEQAQEALSVSILCTVLERVRLVSCVERVGKKRDRLLLVIVQILALESGSSVLCTCIEYDTR